MIDGCSEDFWVHCYIAQDPFDLRGCGLPSRRGGAGCGPLFVAGWWPGQAAAPTTIVK